MKDIDLKEVQEKLDSLRDYLSNFAASTSKIANRQFRDTRGQALDTAHEAEEMTSPRHLFSRLESAFSLATSSGAVRSRFKRPGSRKNQVNRGTDEKGRLRGHTRNLP